MIHWTNAAVEDLQEIRDYIARDSEHNAASVIEQILEAVEQSSDFPFIGRVVPEYDEMMRRSANASSTATASSIAWDPMISLSSASSTAHAS